MVSLIRLYDVTTEKTGQKLQDLQIKSSRKIAVNFFESQRTILFVLFYVTYSLLCSALRHEGPIGVGLGAVKTFHANCTFVHPVFSFISSANFHLRLIESIQINRTDGTSCDCENFISLAFDRAHVRIHEIARPAFLLFYTIWPRT